VSEFEARREAALRLLKTTGIRESNYCPPLLRLLWRLGIQVPPPHFASFGATAVLAGAFFAFSWGAIMWLLLWRSAGMTATAVIGTSAIAGAFFGLLMSAYYAYGRKKHGLPDWGSLVATGGA
jgi:Family of unknown function (DUF6404)